MTTLSGEITIIDVADGKNYVLNILGGTRSIVYDKDGKNPLPVATDFDYELLEDGLAVTPTSVSWTTSGRMTGSGTGKLFKPVYTTDVSGGTGGSAVLLDVVYKGLVLKAVAPISISQIGATGSIGDKGEKGDTGTPGKDGVGIVSIEEKYLLSDLISGVEAGGDSWLDQPQVPGKNLRYLWNYEIITYTDGTVIDTEPAVIGMYSEDGRSITGISEKYMATDKPSGITNAAGVWEDEVQPLTPTNKYLWNYEIISYDKEPFTQKTKASMIGVYGDQGIQGDQGDKGEAGIDGKGIKSITSYYAINNSVIAPMKGAAWGTAMKTPTATDRNLWSYEKTEYTKGAPTETLPVIIGMYSQDGTSVSKIEAHYLVNNKPSGVTVSGYSWLPTPPPMTPTNKYLWTYSITTYVGPAIPGGSETKNSIPTMIGVYGDKGDTGEKGNTGEKGEAGDEGRGIDSIQEYYAINNSTTAPTSWKTTLQIPTRTNRNLWNYEVITYTKGLPATKSTTPAIIGMFSEDGVSIDKIVEKYLVSTEKTGVVNTAGEWVDIPPLTTATKKYLWNYEEITYVGPSLVGGTKVEKTPPAVIGVYGDKGDKGDQGIQGENAPNLTVQYSASSTGSSPSNTFRPTDKYMRTYNGATYSAWMKIVGEDGSDGAYTNFEFAKGTLAAATGTWQDSPPVIGVNEHVWMRKAQVDKAGSQGAWSTPTRLSGDKGDTGAAGAEGRGIDSIQEYYAINNSMTAPAIGNAAWKTTLQIPTKTNRNLWNYELITYTKGLPATKTTVPAIIGMYSEDGRSLKSIVEKYKISSSPTGITNATTGWDNTPSLTDAVNKYLWNHEEITYLNADGTETMTKTPAVVIGVYGDKGDQGIQGETGLPGRSILSVDVLYGVSTNSGTEPKSWDTLAPAWKNGQFIWSKTVTSYSSGKPTESTPAVITGGQGGVGATGRGISSIKEQYAINEDKSKAPVDWVDEPMPWTFGSYIWTRSVITYTTGSPRTETTKPLVSSEWEAVDVALEMAKEDATAKADAAEAAANLVAIAKADAAKAEAIADAEGLVGEEREARLAEALANLQAAQLDASEKSAAAETAAKLYAQQQDAITLTAAKTDATTKANAAKAAADLVAIARAELAEENAVAHADGRVDAEEQARIDQAATNLAAAIADSKKKADAAEAAAKKYAREQDAVTLTAAKTDATTKANAAEVAAKAEAVAKADLAEENAKAHADGKISTEEQARIDQAAANLAAAKKEAKDKADEARLAAEEYARAQDALLEIGGRNLILNSDRESTFTDTLPTTSGEILRLTQRSGLGLGSMQALNGGIYYGFKKRKFR